jgi:folate-binding protein YgfZ
MNSNWKQFLETEGAVFDTTGVSHFGTDSGIPALDTTLLCDLSHYGLISAMGEEAESFLQNQFCNDVREVNPEQSQLNAYCSPKGRALACFRLFQREDTYYLRLPVEVLDGTLNRLRMFVLMSKVTLDDASGQWAGLGFAGPEAEAQLAAVAGQVPAEVNGVNHSDAFTILRVPGPMPRFEVYGEVAAVQELWSKLKQHATPAGYHAWHLQEIAAGLPEVFEATKEAFVPQMLNLQAVDGLSFKKGCYPGQEIVARMQYLGKLKRRMYKAHVETDACPAPGDALFAEGSESGQGVGKVVQAEAMPGGGIELLAVIEISSAEERSLRLGDAEGPLLELKELPYVFEEK